MAAGYPSPAAVAKFREFTSADEDTAINFLKSRGNDPDAAIAAFFVISEGNEPNPTPRPLHYDESAFISNRQGSYDEAVNIPAFQIDDVGEGQRQLSSNTAPSRPPSRVGRPRSDSMITILPSENGLSSTASKQETGVIGSSTTHFGPATRSYYDSSMWALSVTGPAAQEIVPDLEPMDRKRNAGEPVLLKPLPSNDHLPSLITILHSIPAARNALLCPSQIGSDYGYDAAWWNGTPVTSRDVGLSDAGDQKNTQDFELIQEVQRLMAFLDLSDRSYGSVEALSRLKAMEDVVRDHAVTKSLADQFLITWTSTATAISQSEELLRLFRSTALKTSQLETEQTHFWCFENILDENSNRSRTLYDAVDDAVWALDPFGDMDIDTSVEKVADVFVMRLVQQDSTSDRLNVKIPTSWFIDRYLPENASVAKQMRRETSVLKAKAAELESKERRLHTLKHRSLGKAIDTLKLLDIVMSYFDDYASEGSADSILKGKVTLESSRVALSQRKEILEQLEIVRQSVRSSLEALTTEKVLACESLQKSSNLLKSRSHSPDNSPIHEYQLCGLSTKPQVTYIRHNETQESKPDSGNEQTSQWWRLEYTNEPRLLRTKISESELLEKAETEHREIMVVYAARSILDAENVPLPQPLIDFVMKDNASFAEERKLQSAANGANWDHWHDEPPAYDGDWPTAEEAQNKLMYKMSANDWERYQESQAQQRAAQMESNRAGGITAAKGKGDESDITMGNTESHYEQQAGTISEVEHVEYADN